MVLHFVQIPKSLCTRQVNYHRSITVSVYRNTYSSVVGKVFYSYLPRSLPLVMLTRLISVTTHKLQQDFLFFFCILELKCKLEGLD